jgi:hypothetical protein
MNLKLAAASIALSLAAAPLIYANLQRELVLPGSKLQKELRRDAHDPVAGSSTPPMAGRFLADVPLAFRSRSAPKERYQISFRLGKDATRKSWVVFRCSPSEAEVQYVLQLSAYLPR